LLLVGRGFVGWFYLFLCVWWDLFFAGTWVGTCVGLCEGLFVGWFVVLVLLCVWFCGMVHGLFGRKICFVVSLSVAGFMFFVFVSVFVCLCFFCGTR